MNIFRFSSSFCEVGSLKKLDSVKPLIWSYEIIFKEDKTFCPDETPLEFMFPAFENLNFQSFHSYMTPSLKLIYPLI